MQSSQLAFSSHQREDRGLGRREKEWRKKNKKNEGRRGLVRVFFILIFALGYMESTCLSVQKNNVVSQKMHIACNYKGWWVHCSILNLKGKCAKHTISWGGGGLKCNKPKLLYKKSRLRVFKNHFQKF